MSPAGRRWVFAAAVVACHAWAAIALAHSGGQPAGGCEGCHGSGDHGISVSTSPAAISPGDAVTVTLTISSGAGVVAGTFIDANAGVLSSIAGQGLASVNQGLTHTSPKSLQGGSASFSFAWVAPDRPGAVRFEVSTVVANDNGSSNGDSGDAGAFDFVYGCEPFTYYRDADGDGDGQDDNVMIHCAGATPVGYSTEGGDCNDNDGDVFIGATEVCNKVDDDCDGEVDDDAIPIDLYLDEDGDGYYGAVEYEMGVQAVGCVPATGYAGYPGDCEPSNAEVHPAATEVCNLIDDDCDANVDEKVRPRCGEGWCEREASTCDPETCLPGDPSDEICNLLDENCDGTVDEDAPCDAGLACVGGTCVDDGLAPPPAEGGGTSDGGCAVSDRDAPAFGTLMSALSCAWLVRRRSRRITPKCRRPG
jgi:hypothetical protein